jgi:hypothetical protein
MATAVFGRVGSAAPTTGTASLRPSGDSEDRLDFAPSRTGIVIASLIALGFAPPAIFGPAAGRIFYGVVILIALACLVRRLFWREHLTLDLDEHRYTYQRGYWPNVALRDGALSEIKAVRLSVVARQGGRNGDIITWIVALDFGDAAPPLAVASYGAEALAYAYVTKLAQRLRLATIDTTGSETKTTAFAELAKPLAARSAQRFGRHLSPPPDASGMTMEGDAPYRLITLPRPQIPMQLALFPLFAMFPLWFGGMLRNFRMMLPMIAVSGIAVVITAATVWTRKEIREQEDDIVITSRLAGLPVGTRRIAKRAVTDVTVKPIPSTGWRRQNELQIRSTDGLVNLRAGRLAPDALAWLQQAVTAFAER